MMLRLPVKIIEKLRDAIDWAINRARSLLYDRHLDNTVLCVLYGVAKVMRLKPEVSFKKIIAAHKKCNGAKLEIIRHVVLTNNERGDVIQFYNKVFIPRMKSYLLSLAPSTTTSTTADQQKSSSPTTSKKKKKKRKIESKTNAAEDSTPKKKPANETKEEQEQEQIEGASPRRIERTNVFVMPRRVSMTPRTRALYAFGESPRRDLMRINRAVKTLNSDPSISEIFASAAESSNNISDDEYLKNRHNSSSNGLSY